MYTNNIETILIRKNKLDQFSFYALYTRITNIAAFSTMFSIKTIWTKCAFSVFDIKVRIIFQKYIFFSSLIY